jgi:hypothetical protein
MRAAVHLVLHLAVPGAVALLWRDRWVRAFAILVSMMVIDLDHLIADPIYDPNRCSLGFHPLHAFEPIPLYGMLALWKRTRLAGIGLLIHVALDGVDCAWMRI